MLSEVGHHSQIITRGDGRVVAALELLQHHFSQTGHRNTSCDLHLHQTVEQPTLRHATRSVRRASGLVLVGNSELIAKGVFKTQESERSGIAGAATREPPTIWGGLAQA